MTRWTLIPTLMALAWAACGDPPDRGDVELGANFECRDRPADSTGYLEPICEYIAARFDSYPEDPNMLEIEGVVPGDEQELFAAPEYASDDYVFVGLSCCFTGDWAVVAVETGEVVELYLGDM